MLALLTWLVAVGQVWGGSWANLAGGFVDPPSSARPWVYWFWMNGNVTSNGISADLEAMRRVGIGGVLIMEVDYDTPPGPVAFGGSDWQKLFQHVCGESKRLGLAVRMNNDAGYCGSGGPWITPALSMQKLVWTERVVTGSADLERPLEQPQTTEGYYRDIAVLAFPTPAAEALNMEDFGVQFAASPGVASFDQGRLRDGDTNTAVALPQPTPENPSFIALEFSRPFPARQLTLNMPLAGDQVVHGFLQSSADGTNFVTVREFDVIPSTRVFNFPEARARFFRILFPSKNADVDQFVISEVELSARLRIEGIEAKALFTRKNYYPGPSEFPGRATYPEPAPERVLNRGEILDLTGNLRPDGSLAWLPPAGSWTVLRLGQTSTGKRNHPAPEAGLGLESDKLSKAATEAAFEGLMGKLARKAKPYLGKTLVSTHIDSWEIGSQNWTAEFPGEFTRRRGYDPLRFLPVMTGRVVDGMEISERFLWDLRQTVSELVAENYAGHMRTLARSRGLELSIEAYDGPNDDLTYAGRADEPMAEFWSWPPFEMTYTCTEMTSAAHVYGKLIIGAEAFTAVDSEKWLGHPYTIKAFGDWAFCEGINRLIIHRYAHQPWTEPTRLPGMAFGPFGVHFERTQTWWQQSESWNEYLARCQFLLQQGLPVADICYLAPEMAPRRWRAPNAGPQKDGYAFDGCPAEALLQRASIKKGRLTFPDGMSYRLLALQETETMTPELLEGIRKLVVKGATVVGAPPRKSPSLSNYPACDSNVAQWVEELWGGSDSKTKGEHKLGRGTVIWGRTPQQVLAQLGVPPDFRAWTSSGPASFSYVHRTLPVGEVYFVANKSLSAEEAVCAFRAGSARPQLWWPDTGKVKSPAVYNCTEKTLQMPLRLEAGGSVFVVFRKNLSPETDRIVSVSRNGAGAASTFAEQVPPPPVLPDASNTFTIAFWALPQAGTSLPAEAVFGKGNYFNARNDVLFPMLGHFVFHSPHHAGVGISVGTNGVWVIENSSDYWGSPLVYAGVITNWTHFAVVYDDARPRLYLNGKLVREGLRSLLIPHCSLDFPQRRASAPFVGRLGQLAHIHRALTEPEVTRLMSEMPVPTIEPGWPAIEITHAEGGNRYAETWSPGAYVAETASGARQRFQVDPLPQLIELRGPWRVQFQKDRGAPDHITLERLISWSDHPDPGVQHFSGEATYSTEFDLPRVWLGSGKRVWLDLGQVAIMASVSVNGTELGTLWKPPFRLDISERVKAGRNELQVNVVNLWINRMIGDEDRPEDSERNPNGSLKAWPEWLARGEPSPTGRYSFTTYRLWKKDAPLQTSGLVGPVLLVPSVRVPLSK